MGNQTNLIIFYRYYYTDIVLNRYKKWIKLDFWIIEFNIINFLLVNWKDCALWVIQDVSMIIQDLDEKLKTIIY